MTLLHCLFHNKVGIISSLCGRLIIMATILFPAAGTAICGSLCLLVNFKEDMVKS